MYSRRSSEFVIFYTASFSAYIGLLVCYACIIACALKNFRVNSPVTPLQKPGTVTVASYSTYVDANDYCFP